MVDTLLGSVSTNAFIRQMEMSPKLLEGVVFGNLGQVSVSTFSSLPLSIADESTISQAVRHMTGTLDYLFLVSGIPANTFSRAINIGEDRIDGRALIIDPQQRLTEIDTMYQDEAITTDTLEQFMERIRQQISARQYVTDVTIDHRPGSSEEPFVVHVRTDLSGQSRQDFKRELFAWWDDHHGQLDNEVLVVVW